MNFINERVCEFEMGTTQLNKMPLFVRKIQTPENFDYQPFADIIDVDLGGGISHGFSSATYTWVNPDPQTVYNIKRLVDNALNNDRKLYIKIPINDGEYVARTYGDFVGIPHFIDAEEQSAMYGQGVVYNTLTLFVNNLSDVSRVFSDACPIAVSQIGTGDIIPTSGDITGTYVINSVYNSINGNHEILIELDENWCVDIDTIASIVARRCDGTLVYGQSECIRELYLTYTIAFTLTIEFKDPSADCVCSYPIINCSYPASSLFYWDFYIEQGIDNTVFTPDGDYGFASTGYISRRTDTSGVAFVFRPILTLPVGVSIVAWYFKINKSTPSNFIYTDGDRILYHDTGFDFSLLNGAPVDIYTVGDPYWRLTFFGYLMTPKYTNFSIDNMVLFLSDGSICG